MCEVLGQLSRNPDPALSVSLLLLLCAPGSSPSPCPWLFPRLSSGPSLALALEKSPWTDAVYDPLNLYCLRGGSTGETCASAKVPRLPAVSPGLPHVSRLFYPVLSAAAHPLPPCEGVVWLLPSGLASFSASQAKAFTCLCPCPESEVAIIPNASRRDYLKAMLSDSGLLGRPAVLTTSTEEW